MEKILERLKEITSYYSFGRILGYIAFKETIGIEKQLVHGQMSSIERLISNEIDFLVGMWMTNVVIDKSWPINQDDNIMSEVYVLMNDLHNAYGYATALGSQLLKRFSMKAIWVMIGNLQILLKRNTTILLLSKS